MVQVRLTCEFLNNVFNSLFIEFCVFNELFAQPSLNKFCFSAACVAKVLQGEIRLIHLFDDLLYLRPGGCAAAVHHRDNVEVRELLYHLVHANKAKYLGRRVPDDQEECDHRARRSSNKMLDGRQTFRIFQKLSSTQG